MFNDAKIISLGELVDTSAGYPLRKSASGLGDGDVFLLQLRHVSVDADIDWASVPRVELPPGRSPKWLSDRDVVFSARGTRTLAYPLTDTPAQAVCAPQFFVLSTRDENTLLPHFLAWQINQRPSQDYLAQRSTGAVISNIRRRALEEMPIVVPPLGVQQSIVDFWLCARDERAVLNQLIVNRERQLDMLAFELFQNSRG